MASSDDQMQARADAMLTEAMRLIDAGREAGVDLRLTGGLAIRYHCRDRAFLNREYSDIDFVGRSAQAGKLRPFFERLGYFENYHVVQVTGGAQRQFVFSGRLLESRVHMLKRPRRVTEAVRSHGAAEHVDVFLDVLRMDHDVKVGERMYLDDYALAAADLLLMKLQIGALATKDAHDVIGLLKDLPLGCDDVGHGQIYAPYLVEKCCCDWGLYSDVMSNLDLIDERLSDGGLAASDERRVRRAIKTLQEMIDAGEKTLRWRVRSRVGRRLPWRREVEETGREPVIEASSRELA